MHVVLWGRTLSSHRACQAGLPPLLEDRYHIFQPARRLSCNPNIRLRLALRYNSNLTFSFGPRVLGQYTGYPHDARACWLCKVTNFQCFRRFILDKSGELTIRLFAGDALFLCRVLYHVGKTPPSYRAVEYCTLRPLMVGITITVTLLPSIWITSGC